MAASESQARAAEPICSLPIVGETLLEDAVFYVAVSTLATAGWVSWPTAALIGSAHALHQRARNIARTGAVSEAREGLIEAVDEAL
jgi:hypothetical protein